MVELACVIKIFVARLDLTEKRHQASKWTSGNYTKNKQTKKHKSFVLKMICLLLLKKQFARLKHVFVTARLK